MFICCIKSEKNLKEKGSFQLWDCICFISLRVDRQTCPDDHMVAQSDKDPKMTQPNKLWKSTFNKCVFIVFATWIIQPLNQTGF